MMLKVLIADDEPYVREGIKKIINWEEIGFEICGEGTDGDDTYFKILDLDPDLVLIDIKMPGKLGLEVIKECRENGYRGNFVIISGYSDFQYAQEAIKYGVTSYLLKPIDEEELCEIISNLKKHLELKKDEYEKAKMKTELIKEYSLVQVILGQKIANYEGFVSSVDYSNYTLSLISLGNQSSCLSELKHYIRKKVANYKDVMVCEVRERIALLFCDYDENYIMSILNMIRDDIQKIFGQTIFLTLGEKVETVQKIALSYSSSNDLMSYEFLFLDEGILSQFKLQEITQEKLTLVEQDILDKLYSYIEIGEFEKIEECLFELKRLIQSKLYTEDKVKVLMTKSCLDLYEKIKVDYEIGKEMNHENEQLINEIYNTHSLSKIIEILSQRFNEISRKISFNSSDKSIKRIVRYIDKNYYKDLKLEYLSKIFNYNSAYLGKVFKNYTGMSFNIYLDTVRIHHAKELLLEDKIKVYQVCERVGYKNIDYFHSKFKKYVGISPLNYKKQLESEKVKSLNS